LSAHSSRFLLAAAKVFIVLSLSHWSKAPI
jgi:hypothetical protein